MIRYTRYALIFLLAVALITVAIANRSVVHLELLPTDISAFLGFGYGIDVPLFLVIFGGIIAGLLIGFVWEWLRESKHRSAATTRSREVARLEREVSKLRDAHAEPQDDVLALLDQRKAG